MLGPIELIYLILTFALIYGKSPQFYPLLTNRKKIDQFENIIVRVNRLMMCDQKISFVVDIADGRSLVLYFRLLIEFYSE